MKAVMFVMTLPVAQSQMIGAAVERKVPGRFRTSWLLQDSRMCTWGSRMSSAMVAARFLFLATTASWVARQSLIARIPAPASHVRQSRAWVELLPLLLLSRSWCQSSTRTIQHRVSKQQREIEANGEKESCKGE